jgi:hypothetical protein
MKGRTCLSLPAGKQSIQNIYSLLFFNDPAFFGFDVLTLFSVVINWIKVLAES